MKIWRCPYYGLGDNIANLCYLSKLEGTQYLNKFIGRDNKFIDNTETFYELIKELHINNIQLTYKTPNILGIDVSRFVDKYNLSRIWNYKNTRKVCVQFSVINRYNEEKLFKNDEIKHLKSWFKENNISYTEIGLPLTIRQILNVIEESDLFIGIDSGMAHLCLTTGIPVYLKDYSNIDKWFPNKPINKINIRDFIDYSYEDIINQQSKY